MTSLLYTPWEARLILQPQVPMATQNEIRRRYTGRLLGGFAAYAAILIPAILWLNRHPESAWRVPVALLPVLPVVFVLWSMRRYFREADELQKRIQLEGFAFGFAGVAMAMLTYGFLEMAGFPRLSAWWYWTAMGACWMVGSIVASRSYR